MMAYNYSSGGPSVTAVSMSPTPLDVMVKTVKTELDHDQSGKPKVNSQSTLCQRVLQVKLTRLPTCLLTLGTINAINSLDVNAVPALGLHSELDLKFEPGEEVKEEPQDCSLDDNDPVDDNCICNKHDVPFMPWASIQSWISSSNLKKS